MTLLTSVQAKIKTATQKDVESVFNDLPSSMTEDRILGDAAKLNDFIQKLQTHMNSKLSTQSSQALSTEVKPTPKVTLPVTSQSNKAVDTVETAKDRREVAAATVMTSGQDAVSQVLEKATKKANDLIAAKLESMSDTLAEQMAKTMEDEILSSVGFFGQMLTQGTDRIHKQIGEVMEGEIVS